jgi:hypothetical protein
MNFLYEIGDVAAAVEDAADDAESGGGGRGVVGGELGREFGVGLSEAGLEVRAGGFELGTDGIVAGLELFEGHVEFEDFFEEFGGDVVGALLADVEAVVLEEVFGALGGVAEDAVGVVEEGGFLESGVADGCFGASEAIGVEFAAAGIKTLLQLRETELQRGREAQNAVVVHR